MRLPRYLPAFSLVVLCTACGAADRSASDGAGSAVAAAIDTVGGIERLTYPGTGGPRLAWSFDTVAIIGEAFGTEEYQFDRVTAAGLAGDAEGNVYVLDPAGSRVLKYGPDGRYLASWGREGGGPAELGRPVALALGPGDTLWVADSRNRRYTGFPIHGGEPRTVRIDGSLGNPTGGLTVREHGFLQSYTPPPLSRLQQVIGRARSGIDLPEPERRIPLRFLSLTGESVATPWLAPEPPMRLVTVSGGVTIGVRRAFRPRFRWAQLSDGTVVVSDTAEYVLHLVRPDGARVRSFGRDLPARAVTEADREAERERLISQGGSIAASALELAGAMIARGGGSGRAPSLLSRSELAEEEARAMEFEPVIPRVVGIVVDRADRIWVGISLDRPDTVERVDIFDRDGRLLGELTSAILPDAFTGSDHALVLRRDELDVQQVVVMRIRT